MNSMTFWGMVMGASGVFLFTFFIYFNLVVKHINFIFFKRKKGRAYEEILKEKYPGQYFWVRAEDWKLLDFYNARGLVKAIKITGLINSFILESDSSGYSDKIYFVVKNPGSVSAWEDSISNEITRIETLNKKAYDKKMYDSI